jgi:carboxyl-terminal processing protease
MPSLKKVLVVSGLAFVAGMGATFAFEQRLQADDDLYKQLRPLMESMALIQNNYVDEDKVKSQALVQGAIKGMMGQLDPFSQYMDPQENTDMKQDTQGSFGGLGIEISMKAKVLTVVSPIEDTPADKAGIKSGDSITKINGESTDGMELMDAVHKMRGEAGTKVVITIYRDGFEAPKDFSITRAVIKIRSVKSNMLEGKVGYIRLSSFMGKSAEDFDAALSALEAKGAQSLIVDVRNNPGGLLNAAAEISGNFVPKGKVVVSTAGRYKDKDMRFESEGTGDWHKPTVVLINGGSASASEILAGALQDYGLAVVVGTKSFGKGSVQTIMPLSDGGALRLTTAKYLTPKGRSLHGQGIDPDVVAEEEPVSKAMITLYEENLFEVFVKEYLLEHPGFNLDEQPKDKEAVKVSESSWQHLKPESRETKLMKDMQEWLAKRGKGLDNDDFARERSRFLAKVKEELARKSGGEDAAREIALANDPQIHRALDVLKVASVYQSQSKAKVATK